MMDFSGLRPHVEAFTGPDGHVYELRSATAAATVVYRDAMSRTATWDGDKVVKFGASFGAELNLVGLCVFSNGNPIGEAAVSTWPPEAVSALYRRVVEVSPGLHADKEGKPTADPKKSKGSTDGPS